jgi:hypothetical protein
MADPSGPPDQSRALCGVRAGETTTVLVVSLILVILIASLLSSPAIQGARERPNLPAVATPSPNHSLVSRSQADSTVGTLSGSRTGPQAGYSGQYLEGVYYSGPTTTATTVQADIAVPHDSPPTSDFYYVVVSAWDSSNSYDFVGIANNYGTWQVVYLSTSSCPTTETSFNPTISSQKLNPGLTYLFALTASSGTISFNVLYSSNGTSLWGTTSQTGGSSFDLETTFTCTSGSSGISSYGYFEYEDVRAASNTVPPYNFYLETDISTWTSYSVDLPTTGPVAGLGVWFSNDETDQIFANDQYYVNPTSDVYSVTVESESQVISESFAVEVFLLGEDTNTISLTANVPTGLTNFVLSTSSGTAPYTSEVSYSIEAGIGHGVYSLQIVAFDGTGSYNRFTFDIIVLPALAVSPQATPGSGGLDVGQQVTFTAGASGGAGGYTYSWPSLPPGCSASATASTSCPPSEVGTFTVTVSVTDSLGYSLTGSLQYEVYALPSITSVMVTASQITEGQSVTFTVVATQGSGGLSYTWSGLPAGCTTSDTATLSCTPTTTGQSEISVSVADSNHGTAQSTPLAFSVTSGSSGGGGSSSSSASPINTTSLLIIIAVVAAVAAIVAGVLLSRRGGKPGSAQWTPPPVPRGNPPSQSATPPPQGGPPPG